MKRTLCLLLALVFVLALTPAVRADVIWIPEDPFLEEHMDQCSHHQRGYYAAGPNGTVTVYASPESSAVSKKLPNGEYVFISWAYTDADGIGWGFCEHWGEDLRTDWTGWMPMDYLLLKYDHISFQEEFDARIVQESGELEAVAGEVHFWSYPGSDSSSQYELDAEYPPHYECVFTDDAGRNWGYIGYDRGIRNVWVCLDDPTADYDTLYKDAAPQQVTHPTKPDLGTLDEIKPTGPDMALVLTAAVAVAVISGVFLWLTRKKK